MCLKTTYAHSFQVLLCIIATLLTNQAISQTPAATKTKRLFRQVDYEASWSHEGARITFISNRNGAFNLYTIDSAGKQLVQLTFKNANDDMPVFSPDSKRIAFVSDMDGNNEVYTINADGTNLRRMTNDLADDIHPHWSPDGRSILFNSSKNSNDLKNPDRYDLMLLSTVTGEIEELTEDGINTYGSFSSGGLEILYRRSNGEKSQIMIMTVKNRNVRAITDGHAFDGWPSWGKGDKNIYFASDRSGSFQIYRIDLNTSRIDLMTEVPGRFTNPRLSPDGKILMYTGRGLNDYSTGIFLKILN